MNIFLVSYDIYVALSVPSSRQSVGVGPIDHYNYIKQLSKQYEALKTGKWRRGKEQLKVLHLKQCKFKDKTYLNEHIFSVQDIYVALSVPSSRQSVGVGPIDHYNYVKQSSKQYEALKTGKWRRGERVVKSGPL